MDIYYTRFRAWLTRFPLVLAMLLHTRGEKEKAKREGNGNSTLLAKLEAALELLHVFVPGAEDDSEGITITLKGVSWDEGSCTLTVLTETGDTERWELVGSSYPRGAKIASLHSEGGSPSSNWAKLRLGAARPRATRGCLGSVS